MEGGSRKYSNIIHTYLEIFLQLLLLCDKVHHHDKQGNSPTCTLYTIPCEQRCGKRRKSLEGEEGECVSGGGSVEGKEEECNGGTRVPYSGKF